jgi:hypothetical protein
MINQGLWLFQTQDGETSNMQHQTMLNGDPRKVKYKDNM